MNTHEKLITAAKRAAKKLARETGTPHQKALDAIAVQAGRPTWSAFLDDPVPVDENARAAAAEPDYSSLPASTHMTVALAYGMSIGADGMTAAPRAWNDGRTVLTYLTNLHERPVDARGLDLDALAVQIMGEGPTAPASYSHVERAVRVLPVFEGRMLKADVRRYHMETGASATIAVALGGGRPPEIDRPRAPLDHGTGADATPTRSLGAAIRRRTRSLMGGDRREALRRLVQRGQISTTRGPAIGMVGGRTLRLGQGYGLMMFSPPGTGQIPSVVLPALLTDDESSYVVHDDGQILEITSGWRAKLGRVAVVRTDRPCSDAFNPFDAEWLPSDPDMIRHYVRSVMLIIANSNMSLALTMTDVATTLIRDAGGTTLREVRTALTRIEDQPLAAMAAALLTPLVTDSMHQAFGRNTIVPEDLRGRATQGGRPFTLYLMRGRRAERRDIMVAVVQWVIWRYTLSYGPGESMGDKGSNGPCAFVSMLADLHRMPTMTGISQTLDLQRAKKHSTIITSAAGTAMEERYGADEALHIRQCCSLRMAVAQSDPGDMPFVDPYDQVGYGMLSQIEQGKAYLLAEKAMPPIMIKRLWFWEHPRILERAYNVRIMKGPKPVA